MANLPAEWHQMSRPVRHDLEFFVAAGGGATWDPFQLRDAADGILDLTGCTISAEIRNDNDELLVVLTAEFVDITTASCRVSSTAPINAALIDTGSDARRGARRRLGTYAVFITDADGRWCVKAGDAYGISK